MITKEQYQYMQDNIDIINQARGNSYHSIPYNICIQLNEIYKQEYGYAENITCGRCLLNMLKGLVKVYDNYVPETEPTTKTKKKKKCTTEMDK